MKPDDLMVVTVVDRFLFLSFTLREDEMLDQNTPANKLCYLDQATISLHATNN